MSARSLKSMRAAASTTFLKKNTQKELMSCFLSRRSTAFDKPSPVDFDKFMPWICLQLETSVEVAVIKTVLEKIRRKSSTYSSRLKYSSRSVTENVASKQNETLADPNIMKKIQITACYDTSNHLAEIAIIKTPSALSGKIIKCINICLPFHPSLSKITIRSGLTSNVLYEIAKMLPHSNITDLCLDDCYLSEGNYFKLLDYISPLRVLSLKRCSINDEACKKIANRMDLGETGSKLAVLDLGSNEITDKGVWFIADVLRRNRSLVHLNLASNRITDCGLMYIMNHLKEFQMNEIEIFGRNKRRLEFIQRMEMAKLEKSTDKVNQSSQVHFGRPRAKSKTGKKKNKSEFEMTDVISEAAVKEQFNDVFDDTNVAYRDGNTYCFGNFALSSLNVAYNSLDYFSIKRVLEVLNYQKENGKLTLNQTGLKRLVLEGNPIPQFCEELKEIGAILNSLPPVRSPSSLRALKSRSGLSKKSLQIMKGYSSFID